MSQRLQVLLPDAEMAKSAAWPAAKILPWAWVRRALRLVRSSQAGGDTERTLAAIRKAVTSSYPTATIEQMLDEIERGYLE
jgi:hypothetical protein